MDVRVAVLLGLLGCGGGVRVFFRNALPAEGLPLTVEVRGPVGRYRLNWFVDDEAVFEQERLWVGSDGADQAFVPGSETTSGEVWTAAVERLRPGLPPRWTEPMEASVEIQ